MSDKPDDRDLLRRRRRAIALGASYGIGFAKPDPQHQFQSGNKMGARPRKRVKGDGDPVTRLGQQKITVLVNGRKVKMSRNDVVLSGILTDAVRGDRHARKLWTGLTEKRVNPVVEDERHYREQKAAAAEVFQKLELMAERLRASDAIDTLNPADNTDKPEGEK